MHGLLKQPGYRLYAVDSPEAEAVLADVGLTRADLDRAIAALERSQRIRVRSIVGINPDAVFSSTREGWHPDLPDACKEPFVPLLWVEILELLGRVPAGSTARFLEDGDPAGLIGPDLAHSRRRASCPAAISSKSPLVQSLRQLRERGIELRVVPSRVRQP